jgi:hypothetical protein
VLLSEVSWGVLLYKFLFMGFSLTSYGLINFDDPGEFGNLDFLGFKDDYLLALTMVLC